MHDCEADGWVATRQGQAPLSGIMFPDHTHVRKHSCVACLTH